MIGRSGFLSAILGLIFVTITELHSEQVTVKLFAAASTSVPVRELVSLLNSEDGLRIAPVFAASGSLARQIEYGAPADVFISAHPVWMDRLAELNLLRPETRRAAIGNCLVLARPRVNPKLPELSYKLIEFLQERRFAIGDPAFVPAGFYAKEVLDNLGAWEKLSGNMAKLPSARHVILLLERREVPAGIVYHSDTHASDSIQIDRIIDQTMYTEIVYPIAVVKSARKSPQLERAYQFLISRRAGEIFEKHGFRPLAKKC